MTTMTPEGKFSCLLQVTKSRSVEKDTERERRKKSKTRFTTAA